MAASHSTTPGANASLHSYPDKDIETRFKLADRSETFLRIVHAFTLSQKRVLDLGCGYGEHLAHFGKGSVGVTTTPDEVQYGNTRGLEIVLGNVEQIDSLALAGSFDAIWANNLFEHLLSPHAFLIRLRTRAKKGTTLILGVPAVPSVPFLMRFLKFRGALASNHINFFTKKTLALTVERTGWKVRAMRAFFFGNSFLDTLLSPIVPHFYVIAEYDPDFTYPSKKLKEWENEPYYKELLAIAGAK